MEAEHIAKFITGTQHDTPCVWHSVLDQWPRRSELFEVYAAYAFQLNMKHIATRISNQANPRKSFLFSNERLGL